MMSKGHRGKAAPWLRALRPGIGATRFIALPLVVQLLCASCTHWVTIDADFARGTTRPLEAVRIDESKVYANASVSGAVVTVSESTYTKVELDAKKGPVRMSIPLAEVVAVTDGRTRIYDTLGVDATVLRNATVTWPLIIGYKLTPLTFDVRQHQVQREVVSPGRTVATVFGSLVGGAGVLIGVAVLGIWLSFETCKPPPSNPCACRFCG